MFNPFFFTRQRYDFLLVCSGTVHKLKMPSVQEDRKYFFHCSFLCSCYLCFFTFFSCKFVPLANISWYFSFSFCYVHSLFKFLLKFFFCYDTIQLDLKA